MVQPTRRRGSSDTIASGSQGGGSPALGPARQAVAGLLFRTADRRALGIALAVALLLHLPFIPNPLLGWLDVMLSVGHGELTDYDGGETIVPIDLDLLANDPVAVERAPASDGTEAPADSPRDPGAAAPAPPPPTPPAAASAPDAGADAGPRPKNQPADGGAPRDPRTRSPDPREPSDAGAGDGGKTPEPENGAPTIRDPLSAAGSPGKLASKDPNVQVLIAGDRLRKHELGPWFGRILTTIPEWQSFFKDTPIDPIRDLDHLLIAGPQFRDSSQVVAVMDYRIPEADIRAALDVVVARSNGAWIKDAPVPAARAKADRAERLFALVPQRRLLVVMPADQEGELSKLKRMKSFNRSSAAGIVISMLTPANAFRHVYKLPPGLKWMRLTVTPTQDDGADVALTAGDQTAEDAATHAEEFTRNLNAIRTIDLGITRIDALDEIKVVAEGDVLWTKIHIKSKQLKLIMGFVEQMLKDQVEARRKGKKE